MTQAAIVSAFVKDGAGGNLAGVVLDAAGIEPKRRQEIAAKLALSETVFVEPAAEGFRLRYFTPTQEIDLCGHATIAAFCRMLEEDRITPGFYRIDTKAGELGVVVSAEGLAAMSQNAPFFGASAKLDEVSRALGGARVLHARVVSTGLPDLIVKVESRDALLALKPEMDLIRLLTVRLGATSLHVFAPGEGSVTAYCRDFAPAVGIPEEPATGTASGALACHLVDLGLAPAGDLAFVQGESMGRPSLILARVEATGRNIERVQVGGFARLERLEMVS